jgi:TonB family protein
VIKLKKSETYGIIGTLIFSILLLLILFLCSISGTFFRKEEQLAKPQEEGMSVNFGNSADGQGAEEPAPANVTEQTAPSPVPETVSKISKASTPSPVPEKALVTQNYEQSEAYAEERKKEKEREKQDRENKKIEQQKVDEQRRVEAEKSKRISEINARAQGAFSKGNGPGGIGTSSNSGEGNGTGKGNQGNPFGDNSKNRVGTGGTGNGGSSFKLGNRRVVGKIPEPSDNTQVIGKIVVDITVNANGDVTAASIGQGTNITEPTARNAAMSAARKAKFSKGEASEIGVITYNYKLN